MSFRIIIDGNDGVGKTTLAKKLQNDLGIKSYIHLTNKDRRDQTFYRVLLDKNDVIFDRSFVSEPIYSKVFDRVPTLYEEDVDQLIEYAKEANYVFIIAYTTDKKYAKNEYIDVREKSDLIDKYFKEIADKHKLIYYDTHNDNYDGLLTYIKDQFV